MMEEFNVESVKKEKKIEASELEIKRTQAIQETEEFLNSFVSEEEINAFLEKLKEYRKSKPDNLF